MSSVLACHQRKDTKQVLRYVNGIRRELGLKPLRFLAKGVAGSSTKCSIALSLTTKYTEAEVGGGSISINRYSRLSGNQRGEIVQTIHRDQVPKYVSDWISKFDDSTAPEFKAMRRPLLAQFAG